MRISINQLKRYCRLMFANPEAIVKFGPLSFASDADWRAAEFYELALRNSGYRVEVTQSSNPWCDPGTTVFNVNGMPYLFHSKRAISLTALNKLSESGEAEALLAGPSAFWPTIDKVVRPL